MVKLAKIILCVEYRVYLGYSIQIHSGIITPFLNSTDWISNSKEKKVGKFDFVRRKRTNIP
jgi:hypothetical protein